MTTETCLFIEQSTSSLTRLEKANSIAVSIVSCITACSASAGNVLALVVFFRFRRLRSLPNILLTSLCLTDLLTGIVVQPLFAARRLREINHYYNLCEIRLIYIFFANLCAGASMLTVGLVTIDRCTAITAPYRYLSIASHTLYIIIIAVVWCTWTAFVSLPFVGILSMSQYFSGMTTIFVLTILTVLVSYAFIYRVVRQQRRKIFVTRIVKEPDLQVGGPNLSQKEYKVAVRCQLFAASGNNAAVTINEVNTDSPVNTARENEIAALFDERPVDGSRLSVSQISKADDDQSSGQSTPQNRRRNSQTSTSRKEAKRRVISKLRKLKTEHKQTNTIAIIIGTLLMCYLPQISLLAIRAIYGDSKMLMLIDAWADLLVYLNSSMNPLIYCVRNGEIRKALRCLLKRNRTP